MVMEIDPENTLAIYNIGNDYKRLKDFNTAIEYYNKAFDSRGGPKVYIDFEPNDSVELNAFDVPGYEIYFDSM